MEYRASEFMNLRKPGLHQVVRRLTQDVENFVNEPVIRRQCLNEPHCILEDRTVVHRQNFLPVGDYGDVVNMPEVISEGADVLHPRFARE